MIPILRKITEVVGDTSEKLGLVASGIGSLGDLRFRVQVLQLASCVLEQ